MASQSVLYSVGPSAFTMAATALANGSIRVGTVIVNTSNLVLDLSISMTFTTGAAVSVGDGYMLLATSDGNGTPIYSFPATGTDATFTALTGGMLSEMMGTLRYGDQVPGTGLVFLQKIPANGVAAGTLVSGPPISVAQAIGGNIPYGGVAPALLNLTGQALSATATITTYTGIKYTIA